MFSDEPISAGNSGSPVVRGRETVEQHFIPKIGMVKEVRVSTLGGKLSSRQEIALAGAGVTRPQLAAGGNNGGRDQLRPRCRARDTRWSRIPR
jgi:hypothetical protein